MPVPRVLLSAKLSGSAGPASRLCKGRLPPSPAPPGSGCPQLHRPAATGTAAKVSHLRLNQQRRTPRARLSRGSTSPERLARCVTLGAGMRLRGAIRVSSARKDRRHAQRDHSNLPRSRASKCVATRAQPVPGVQDVARRSALAPMCSRSSITGEPPRDRGLHDDEMGQPHEQEVRSSSPAASLVAPGELIANGRIHKSKLNPSRTRKCWP